MNEQRLAGAGGSRVKNSRGLILSIFIPKPGEGRLEEGFNAAAAAADRITEPSGGDLDRTFSFQVGLHLQTYGLHVYVATYRTLQCTA